jgi:soluble lytic murein transglycosylase
MMKIKIQIKLIGLGIFFVFGTFTNTHVFADEFKKSLKPLDNALDFSEDKNNLKALEEIKKWNPSEAYLLEYKSFWTALWSEDLEKIWKEYNSLKKEKKFLRLRLALFREFLKEENTFKSTRGFTPENIQKEARLILRQMRGTSDGDSFETEYLNWLKRNKYFAEVCRSERTRWLAEGENDFQVLTKGLEKCPMEFDDFLLRLRRLIFSAREEQAESEIEQYAKKFHLPEWQKVYARAIFESHVGQPDEAFVKLQKFETQVLSSDYDINYFYIAQRAGQYEKAEEVIKKILKNTPIAKINDIKFEQGFLFYQLGRYAEANKIFDDQYNKLVKGYKKVKSKRRYSSKNLRELDQVSWLRAWTFYLDGKYELALAAFKDTEKIATDQARLNYWTAMTLVQMDQPTAAFLIFKKLGQPIIDHRAFTYYNLLGWLRTFELKKQIKNDDLIRNLILVTQSPGNYYPAPDDNITRSQMLDHYNQLTDESFETDEGDIQVINSENEVILSDELAGLDVTTDKDLQNQLKWVDFLERKKMSDFARWHLFELERKITNRKKSDPIVVHYLETQNYYRALSLMQRVGEIKNSSTNYKSDILLWKSLYPEAYKSDVQKFSDQRKIDPYFLWSIMRAETQYKADAVSPVGAVGPMQFMAYTMKRLGNLIERNLATTDLFVPKNSIEYGAAYIRKLSVEFDFQPPLIAASYNGGPHRVKSWIKNRGLIDYDVFIEHIPFAETRTYVKRVLGFRTMYDKIYNSKLDPVKLRYLTQKINYKLAETFSLNEEWDKFKKEMQKTN